MQPKMHCKVDGKLLAAVIDRQKIDISLPLKPEFPGFTLDSGAIFSVPAVPANKTNYELKMRRSGVKKRKQSPSVGFCQTNANTE